MSYSFLLLPKAQSEILEAWEWYEDKQPRLGDRFKNEVKRAIGFIQTEPLHYPLKGKYREIRVDIFPYLIVFKIDDINRIIIILSVFHTSRHPKKKLKR